MNINMYVFYIMIDKPTDQVSPILYAHWYGKYFQQKKNRLSSNEPNILNGHTDGHRLAF